MDDTKTMTADDAERAERTLKHALTAWGGDERDRAEGARSRLAALAARVPGLVADLSATQAKFTGAADACLKLGTQIKDAESERDAAKQEAALVPGLRGMIGSLKAANAEQDRTIDALRERVATLFAESEKWKEAARAVNELHDTAEARVRELEAVGDVLAAEPDVLREAVSRLPLGDKKRLHGLLNRLRSAYDAAMGGEHGPDSTCPNCKADHEDAAKYRAAVERLGDTHGLGAATALADGYDKPARGGAIIEDYYRRGLAGARWALGLTLDTPPSGPGGGEDVEPAHRPGCAADTGGPCTRSCESATRARIAPTPTQESLKETFAAIKRSNEEWDRKVAAGMSRCSYGNEGGPCRTAPEDNGWCKYHQHIAAIHEARTQSAPEVPPLKVEVVWEGAGLKVKADGSVWDTHEHRAPWQVTELLACALAEAKREVEGMRGERDAERQIAQEWEAKAYKAAESMRERAAKAARDCACAGNSREWAAAQKAIEEDIRAMPLEES